MKIEAGKYYMTRDWRKVGPMYEKYPNNYPKWGCDTNGYTDVRYYENGTRTLFDMPLISEALPAVGTLAEIGADVGDVVEWMGTLMRENYYFEYTIAEVSPSYRSKGAAMCINLSATEPFRIITKAAKPAQAIPQPVSLKRCKHDPIRRPQ